MGEAGEGRERGVVPEGYQALLGDLKERIRSAQIRAALSVNRELVALYWQIGRAIQKRQGEHGWGAQVIARLSADLRQAFPDRKGFSPRNLQYMRTFAGAYPEESIAQQLLRDLPGGHMMHLLDRVSDPDARLVRTADRGPWVEPHHAPAPCELRGSLPTIEELEATLSDTTVQ